MDTDLGKSEPSHPHVCKKAELCSFSASNCPLQGVVRNYRKPSVSCGEREEGGRERSRMRAERRGIERSTRFSGPRRTGAFPRSLAPVLPLPRQSRDPLLVSPASVTTTAGGARTVRGAPSAGRGSGRREGGALRPEACARPAGPALPPEGRPSLAGPRPGPALPELARLAVHAWQKQPGRLADVVAVHGEAAAMAGVRHGHPDPLHQRRQHEEGPAREDGRPLGRPGGGGCWLSPTSSSPVPSPPPRPAFPGDPASDVQSGGRAVADILIAPVTPPVTPGQALQSLWASVSSSAKQGYHVTILGVLSPSEIM